MGKVRSVLRELIPMLPAEARRFIRFFSLANAALAVLDTISLLIMTLVLTGIMSGGSFRIPLIGALPETWAIPLLVGAAMLMVVKAVLNILLQRRATRRFAEFEQIIGSQLFEAYIRAPWTERLSRTSAQVVRMVDVGMANTISGVIIPSTQTPTNLITFLGALAVLIFAAPLTALVTFVYLGLVALAMYLVVSRRSYQAGYENRLAGVGMVSIVSEMISALKEITLRDKAGEVAKTVYGYQRAAARTRADIRFFQSVPRFIVDIALIGGVLVVGGVSLLVSGGSMDAALTAVAIFGLGGFKMIPAITAMQSNTNQMNAALTHAEAVVRDINDAKSFVQQAESIGRAPLQEHPALLEVRDVAFTYPGAAAPALQGVDLRIPIGSTMGIVGSSGAGKSTLIDLLLGLLVPSHGEILLDGTDLREVLATWRARVGYVPQDVTIFDGTFAQNVALTWSDDADEDRVRAALERAQLLDAVLARPGGIHEKVGERGIALSGGQRQRLGIARALYADPLVLVLDEATSALDSSTEAAVSKALAELAGDVTVISVAHRLSTVRGADQICFMKDGTVEVVGTFDEVVAQSPDFALQAGLAGLLREDPSGR